jgi:1-acyl-sn-glycerol-3-phosphate acyltransferase
MSVSEFSYPDKTLRVYAGSAVLLLWMVVSTVIVSPLIIICALFPFPLRYNIAKTWAFSVLFMAELCCGIRYEVEGSEHIPADTPVIILSNHQSAWETLAFRCIFPAQTSLFKRSLLLIPFWGWAMATLKPIAIDRGNKTAALRKLIVKGTEALKEGLSIVIFPEGTRMPAGTKKKFSAGGAMLAQKSCFPVIPVAHNAGICWPRYSFIKYPGTIRVKIGTVINPEGLKADELNRRVDDWVSEAMRGIGEKTI